MGNANTKRAREQRKNESEKFRKNKVMKRLSIDIRYEDDEIYQKFISIEKKSNREKFIEVVDKYKKTND